MKKTILETKGLCKSFAHNGGQIQVLSNVNLKIYQGDFTVVMGVSGSGKSTLLYALSGMERATAGQVLYDGRNLTTMKEKEIARLRYTDFGFVFQQMHLAGNLSLYENILVPGYLNNTRSAKQVKEQVSMLLERMGISHLKKHLPSQVSGGEQQRCAIARAVINNPKILFADEPTGALNKKNTIEVLDLFTELNKEGNSILMVTHDMKTALRANRILYLEDGKVAGELCLPDFNRSEEKSREAQVNAWLSSLEW